MSDYYSGDYDCGDPNYLIVPRITRARSFNDLRESLNTCSSTRQIYVALFDYEAENHAEISFSKGDLLEIWDNNEEDDWRQARNLISKVLGLVPSLYIAKNGSLQSKEWYFGPISSHEVEKLMGESNQIGTFMIRNSEQRRDRYSLNIKCKTASEETCVKNFKISRKGRKFSLFPDKTFDCLIEMVDYYSKNPDPRLTTALIKPCPKLIPHLWDLTHDHDEQWEIPKTDLQLDRILGKGEFGEVFYGKWLKTIEVAIKRCKSHVMTTEAILSEAKIMKECRHPKLVALYGVCTKDEPIYIVTEFMKNGSLLSYLRTNRDQITFEHLIYIAVQITEGMRFLEGFGLVHRDLAARNVLIGENNLAKIADFGLSRIIFDGYLKFCTKSDRIPVRWTAPEVISKNEYSTKSDVWSFGILMMELFTYGQKPYGDWTNTYVAKQVKGGYRIPKPDTMPDKLYDIIVKCWDSDPDKRPCFVFLNDFFEHYHVYAEGVRYEIYFPPQGNGSLDLKRQDK